MGAEIDLGPPWMGSQLHVSARTGFSGEAVRIRRVLWSGGPISAQGTMTAASNSAAATVDTRIVRARRDRSAGPRRGRNRGRRLRGSDASTEASSSGGGAWMGFRCRRPGRGVGVARPTARGLRGSPDSLPGEPQRGAVRRVPARRTRARRARGRSRRRSRSCSRGCVATDRSPRSEGSIRSPRTCSYTWREKLLEGGPEPCGIEERPELAELRKRVRELERALGRKIYELEILGNGLRTWE